MDTCNEVYKIQKSEGYTGLNTPSIKPIDSFVLDDFVCDDLYQFPMLCEIPSVIPESKLLFLDRRKLSDTFREIHENSPFKVG
jgi:hypothetical protein